MIIRWISLVPSKMVKILEGTGRVISISARASDCPAHWRVLMPVQRRSHGSPPATLAGGVPLHRHVQRRVGPCQAIRGDERNAKRLLTELDSRDAAAAMRVYADEIDTRAAELKAPGTQAARGWAEGIRQHAERTDPLNGPLRLEEVTSCSHEEPQRHMRDWSTQGRNGARRGLVSHGQGSLPSPGGTPILAA
jgi:hypothetical protein